MRCERGWRGIYAVQADAFSRCSFILSRISFRLDARGNHGKSRKVKGRLNLLAACATIVLSVNSDIAVPDEIWIGRSKEIIMENKDDLVRRLQDSYRQLPVVATSLNTESDKLNASVSRLDALLKKHPIGVSSWVSFSERSSFPNGHQYWSDDVGFTKINGKWGLAIRSVSGDVTDPDGEECTEWHFNESPRGLRVRAVSKFPELLEKLIKDGKEMVGEVAAQVQAVDFLADALEATAGPSPVENRARQAYRGKPPEGQVQAVDFLADALIAEPGPVEYRARQANRAKPPVGVKS